MVYAVVCFGGEGILQYIPENAKVNDKLYVDNLLLRWWLTAKQFFQQAVFQPHSTPNHSAKVTPKHKWRRPNSTDLSTSDCCVWGAILQHYQKVKAH